MGESSSEDSVDIDSSNLNDDSFDEVLEKGAQTESETENRGDEQKFPSSEWIEFNNKVTSMRSLFKRAKVQFINKTTRQIKKYRAKKGTPQQLLKNKQKADRLANEIVYINELKKDVVSKFALLHSKEEITEILNSPESTTAYRVKAKIASIPVLSQAAQSFHETHPNWRESLFKLIQLSGKSLKRKRRKIRGVKRKKGEGAKSLVEEKRDKNDTVPVNEEESESSRFHASNFPRAPSDSEIDESEERESDETSQSSDEGDSDVEESNDDVIGKISKRSPVKRKTVSENNEKSSESLNRKSENLTKRARISENDSSETGEDDLSELELSDSSVKTKLPRNVDPFFITADNKEYKTHWKIETAQDIQRQNQVKQKKEIPIVLKNLTPFHELGKKGKQEKSSKKNVQVQSKLKNISKSSSNAKPKLVNLHPSWQAKKNLNKSVVQFEGKKIVFDD